MMISPRFKISAIIFGILADGLASGENDYLYCGKEFQSFFDLPFYDSGARFQRNDGIFLSIDPLL